MKQSFDLAFIKKHLEKPFSKTFLRGSRRKASFFTGTTAMDTQQMSKIESRLVVKPKIIESLSQRFIQAVLMSGRWQKKINLLIEFSVSIFIEPYFKA